MLYSLNRWENKERILKSLNNFEVVVADRYTPSNLAYGTAHGLDEKWLQSLDKGLPDAQAVIVLDVPVRSSFGRKKGGRDIHENDRTFLQHVRRIYLSLGRKHHWHIVEGTGTVNEIQEQVWKTMQKCLGKKS
jgi:dTMP kinase